MKINFKRIIFIFLMTKVGMLFAQSNYSASVVTAGAGVTGLSQGETLFKENKASEAVEVLEYEILSGQISDNTYNFLGLGYYQLGEYEKSIDAFNRGLKAQPQNKKLLSYNLGNTYYAMQKYDTAIECYSDSLREDPVFYDALLNRANALLMAGKLVSAKEDYIDFVEKRPDDSQRERIELLIKALEEEIARREEEARLLAEQNKAKWEEYDGNLEDKKKETAAPDWEKVDGSISENKKKTEIPEWEKVENTISENQKHSENSEWERFHNEEPESVNASTKSEQIAQDDEEKIKSDTYWEELKTEASEGYAIKEEQIAADESWLTFSDDELDEMKVLEEESRAEREKWLEDSRKRDAEIAERKAQARQKEQQQALEEEKRIREQLLEDMRKAEDERRKKLLEDVANSLQGADSTNLTSGAEDLIDYDLEGELD